MGRAVQRMRSWAGRFERSGRPVTTSNQLHQDWIAEMLLEIVASNKKKLLLNYEFLNGECIEKKNQEVWNLHENWRIKNFVIFIRIEISLQDDSCRYACKCSNKRCNSKPGLFSAATSTVYPNLTSNSSHLFPNLKEHLEGQHCSCDGELKSAMREWFQKQNTDFFLKKWIPKAGARCMKCIGVGELFCRKSLGSFKNIWYWLVYFFSFYISLQYPFLFIFYLQWRKT